MKEYFSNLDTSLKFVFLMEVLLGGLGYLCGIFVTVLGAKGVAMIVKSFSDPATIQAVSKLFVIMIVTAAFRGLLSFCEQYCRNYMGEENHSKHVSSVAIASFISVVMAVYIWFQFPVAGVIAAIAFVTVSGMIPVSNETSSAPAKEKLESVTGKANAKISGILKGLGETIQFKNGEKSLKSINKRSDAVIDAREDVVDFEKNRVLLTNLSANIFACIVLGVMIIAYEQGKVSFDQTIIAVVALMSTFGPIVALSQGD